MSMIEKTLQGTRPPLTALIEASTALYHFSPDLIRDQIVSREGNNEKYGILIHWGIAKKLPNGLRR